MVGNALAHFVIALRQIAQEAGRHADQGLHESASSNSPPQDSHNLLTRLTGTPATGDAKHNALPCTGATTKLLCPTRISQQVPVKDAQCAY